MFETAAAILVELPVDLRRRVPALNNWELTRRLRQLDYLFDQATSWAARAADAAAVTEDETALETTITYVECFYLIAWRVGVALTHGGKPLGPFNPTGTSRMRNLLVSHPEHGGPDLPSWAVSGNGDVHLSLTDGLRDAGLLANADEFRRELEALLERHLG